VVLEKVLFSHTCEFCLVYVLTVCYDLLLNRKEVKYRRERETLSKVSKTLVHYHDNEYKVEIRIVW